MTVNKSSVKIKIYFVVEVEKMADKKIKELLKDAGKYELTESERAKADGSFIDLPCGNTHYEIKGDGELCVLVHGYATPYYIYDKVADELVKNGYKILRYDLLGRGLSERVKAKYTPELFATQLKELTGSLFGDEKFYLFGTSMGGTIVNAFCAAYPEYVKKLILLAPAGMDSFKPPFYMYLSSCPVVGDILFAFLGNKILLKSCAREMKYSVNEIDYYKKKKKQPDFIKRQQRTAHRFCACGGRTILQCLFIKPKGSKRLCPTPNFTRLRVQVISFYMMKSIKPCGMFFLFFKNSHEYIKNRHRLLNGACFCCR